VRRPARRFAHRGRPHRALPGRARELQAAEARHLHPARRIPAQRVGQGPAARAREAPRRPMKTSLATSSPDDVFVRGKSLCKELIGKLTFTEMALFAILGSVPTRAQTAVVDACLVTLMEHGLTPSALAARLTYGSAPEAMQSAIAAGLAGVGSVFVG